MKFETVEIKDLGNVSGTVPATLHYHEDQQVHLRIIDESPTTADASVLVNAIKGIQKEYEACWKDEELSPDKEAEECERCGGMMHIEQGGDIVDCYVCNGTGEKKRERYFDAEQFYEFIELKLQSLAQYPTQSLPAKIELAKLTDEDALEIFEISGGGSAMMRESKIFQVKDILTTNKFYNTQTNIPPIVWAKIFDFLIRRGYVLPKGLLAQSTLPNKIEESGLKEGEEQETIWDEFFDEIIWSESEGNYRVNQIIKTLKRKYHITKKP